LCQLFNFISSFTSLVLSLLICVEKSPCLLSWVFSSPAKPRGFRLPVPFHFLVTVSHRCSHLPSMFPSEPCFQHGGPKRCVLPGLTRARALMLHCLTWQCLTRYWTPSFSAVTELLCCRQWLSSRLSFRSFFSLAMVRWRAFCLVPQPALCSNGSHPPAFTVASSAVGQNQFWQGREDCVRWVRERGRLQCTSSHLWEQGTSGQMDTGPEGPPKFAGLKSFKQKRGKKADRDSCHHMPREHRWRRLLEQINKYEKGEEQIAQR